MNSRAVSIIAGAVVLAATCQVTSAETEDSKFPTIERNKTCTPMARIE